ncbi:3-deoxy-7-phosphoheptulonate synthase [Terribacillus saccharophilus]|uniref:bifunctional 3-deoxy-7-phosphoheptulonate synthase/chorismate mutase n=2 Tax=Terribacillus saccharophilus TaxID=361277 RepID=UPI000BA6C000|nr:bifunctional 3-deoxy-7-phosphoheptulonate synthase/chorismate mutase [Terribacillus saccharophilus]PAF37088.1 3-deoxy-7-phosphoheptulonate synthase [Terribacillus saccharophilus]
MQTTNVLELKKQYEQTHFELLKLLNEQASLKQQLKDLPESERSQSEKLLLAELKAQNEAGVLGESTMDAIFKAVMQAKTKEEEAANKRPMLVSRAYKNEDTVIDLKGEKVGTGKASFVFGPCSVESYDQVAAVAESLKDKGLKLLRGGAFKPRSSPYDFQGLGVEGLEILKRAAAEYDLAVISEIVTPHDIEKALDFVDVIQIGARNAQNFELLKEAGRTNKPILLKRALSGTISEFIAAAEYIHSEGNGQIILCERGIRTYETATRNTLDISAVPILKQETHLPVMVDVTHSTGRKDIMLPCAKAALAVGADGVMAEVHPNPAVALSDAGQQMDIPAFDKFYKELAAFQAKI